MVEGVIDLLRARMSRVPNLFSRPINEHQNPAVCIVRGLDDSLDEISDVECA
jgi:hypothetical protein